MSVNIYLDGKLSPVTGEMYQNPALVPDKVADGAVMEKPTGDEVLVTQDSSGTVKAKNFLLDGKQVATIDGRIDIHTSLYINGADLDTLKGQVYWGKRYYCLGGNSNTNKPDGVDHFGLNIIRIAGGWTQQILHSPIGVFFRSLSDSGEKTGWKQLATTTDINKIQGRNLLTVLGVSSVREVFDKIRAMNGDYSSLQLGDYVDIESITVGGTTYKNVSGNLRVEIAGFNHYYRVGDTETAMGVLFVFRNCVTTRPMNDLSTHDGQHSNANGYFGSPERPCDLRKWLNGDFTVGLEKVVGPLKTVHRLLDAHTEASWWTKWAGEKCFLPTEVEVFGTQAWGNVGYSVGTSVQYPIYALDPSRRIKTHNGSRMWWWEATTRNDSSTDFCFCYSDGIASYYGAGYSGGVSPAFYI